VGLEWGPLSVVSTTKEVLLFVSLQVYRPSLKLARSSDYFSTTQQFENKTLRMDHSFKSVSIPNL
jgi:hypothetical protein